jgi:transcriptional regulator with XRE-family HTH domain
MKYEHFSLLTWLGQHGKKAELAKACGIPSGNISNWCKGTAKPSPATIQKIADYLHVPTESITLEFHSPSDDSLHERVKLLCKLRGVTLTKLLVDCNLSKDALTKSTNLSSNSVVRLADHLNTTVDYLLGICEDPTRQKKEPPPLNSDEDSKHLRSLAETIRDLPAEALEKLVEHAELLRLRYKQ